VRQTARQADLPLEQAIPLPAQVYRDPEFYEYELEHIFRKDWICIARIEEVPTAGSYLAADLAGEPLIVVRGNDEKVRVFSRVCRHRYVDLLGGMTTPEQQKRGCAERFECPYHAWTYRLDGSLLNAPEMASRPGFDPDAYGLRPIRTEIWQGFIFVNLDDDTTIPFDMSGMTGVQDSYDFSRWRIAEVVDWGESTVNWKIVVENFAECYHHIGIHKHTLQPMWPIGTVEVGDERGGDWFYSRMFAGPETASSEEDGNLLQPSWLPPQSGLSAYQRSQTLLLAKFPIFMLVPAPDVSFWFRAMPTGPETHRLEAKLLVPEESLEAEGFADGIKEAADFFRIFQAEDASVNERIQSTMSSARATGGVLQLHEQAIWQLQKYLAARLPLPSA
jgi:phenylpropionate dioxygenase-like ring-hydroxylating dioxygenase large terminal subunit